MTGVQIDLDGRDVGQIRPVTLRLSTSATIMLAKVMLVTGGIVEGTYVAIR
jgi:hypothetical protein